MATQTSPAGSNYSARGAMAKALETLRTAERERHDAEARATSVRDAATRQATDVRDRALKSALAQATTGRDSLQKTLSDVERTVRASEQAMKNAHIKLPPGGATSVSPGQTTVSPDQALRTVYNEMVTAWNEFVDAMKELDRVRGTILVRITRKIGLPPL